MVKKAKIKKKIEYLLQTNCYSYCKKNKITAKGFVGKDHNCKEVFGHLHANALL